jgi:hypothetical protein
VAAEKGGAGQGRAGPAGAMSPRCRRCSDDGETMVFLKELRNFSLEKLLKPIEHMYHMWI